MIPQKPVLIPIPFAQNGDRHDIPATNTVPGNPDASWNYGFPQVTGINKQAGGKPPKRLDFQGILHTLSEHVFYQQAGGVYPWDATLNYQIGSIVLGTDNNIYLSLKASGPEMNCSGVIVGPIDPVKDNNSFWIEIDPVKYAGYEQSLGQPDNVTIKKNSVNKLYVPLKPSGGISSDTQGLYVNAPEIIQQGGGLKVDNQGKIYFDAASMDTSVFEALMKKLRLPIWLEHDTTFYVDKSHAQAADSLDEGRGLTENLPFKSIQACINYVCDNFNLGNYNVTIYVKAGDYEESITLPDYAGTTGIIRLFAHPDSTARVKIHDVDTLGAVITAKSRNFHIQGFEIYKMVSAAFINAITSPSYTCGAIRAMDGAKLTVASCDLRVDCQDAASLTKTLAYTLLSSAANSQITLRPTLTSDDLAIPVNNVLRLNTADKVQSYGLDASTGSIHISHQLDSGDVSKIIVKGNGCYYFALANGGSITTDRGGVRQTFSVENSAFSGHRYSAIAGGRINTNGAGPDFFPGDIAGTVQSSTYSWYA